MICFSTSNKLLINCLNFISCNWGSNKTGGAPRWSASVAAITDRASSLRFQAFVILAFPTYLATTFLREPAGRSFRFALGMCAWIRMLETPDSQNKTSQTKRCLFSTHTHTQSLHRGIYSISDCWNKIRYQHATLDLRFVLDPRRLLHWLSKQFLFFIIIIPIYDLKVDLWKYWFRSRSISRVCHGLSKSYRSENLQQAKACLHQIPKLYRSIIYRTLRWSSFAPKIFNCDPIGQAPSQVPPKIHHESGLEGEGSGYGCWGPNACGAPPCIPQVRVIPFTPFTCSCTN